MAGHMGHGRQTGTEKVKDFKGTLLRLGKYLKPYRMSLLLVILVAVTSVIFTIISPKIMAKITDELFRPILEKVTGNPNPAPIDFSYIGRIISILAASPIAANFGWRFCSISLHLLLWRWWPAF